MKRTIILLLLSVFCGVAFAQNKPINELTKMAVYIIDKPQDSIFLKEAVDNALSSSRKYRMVALDARGVIAAEQKRQEKGSVLESDIAELGKASGAKLVCAVRRIGNSVRVYLVGVESQTTLPGRSWILDLPLGKEDFLYVEQFLHEKLGVGVTSNSQSGGTAGKMPEACPSDMVFVKGGTFTMGCTYEQNNCETDEKPTHTVTVGDFCIGKYEVTQKKWMETMGSNPSYFKSCGDDCPVEQVSWNDIQEYTRKLSRKTGKNYRLPTEAEWEYAARGGNNESPYIYSGSNNLDNVGWYTANSGNKTHRVGQKAPNELGIYDMSGNVWEWVNDWYGSDYYGRFEENSPQGPSSGSYRVLRGGGWDGNAQYCRVANRSYNTPSGRGNSDGFRLVLSP